jgi:hypothetical protein
LAALNVKSGGVSRAATRLRQILAAKPPNYFYDGCTSSGEPLDAAQEFVERKIVNDEAEAILQSFVDRTLTGREAINKQKETSYAASNSPPLDGGTPGQSDGSGDLIPKLLLLDWFEQKCPKNAGGDCVDRALAEFRLHEFPELPQGRATATHILSTWRQVDHSLAQIDGSVKSPFFRNIAASLAVAGDPRSVNYENAERCARFLTRLPPPAYPFAVNLRVAERGRAIFQKNCAVCHRARNEIIYRAAPLDSRTGAVIAGIETDPNRAAVLNESAVRLMVQHFRKSVPDDFDTLDSNGHKVKAALLPDEQIVIDRSKPENQGYVADALDGIWARGPYLHGGSVPTLYHLLKPAERPATFVRGSISYDENNVGWKWKLTDIESIRTDDPQAVLFHAAWDGAKKGGHDRNLTVDAAGHILRTDWSATDAADAIKVRLDWSDPEYQQPLMELLEYLKTL